MESFPAAFERLMGSAPPATEDPLRNRYWDQPVSKLCELADPPELTEGDKERHRVYAYLLMGITHHYWSGYKHGRLGDYPWNYKPVSGDPPALDGDYLGHNIAALAIDAAGRVLDFDFNHNELFNSSAEHAEARLVRRLFSLAQVADSWSAAPSSEDALGSAAPSGGRTSLSDVTIYTSLESCSQCSGIMALARVGTVVYLQTDPGMYFIGRILRNLTTSNLRAPLPISGGEIGFHYFELLNGAFTNFTQEIQKTPFHIGLERVDRTPSVTSFLCTSIARGIFGAGGEHLSRLISGEDSLTYPKFVTRPGSLSNAEVIKESAGFRAYAISQGRRGTPHNL